MKKNGPKKSYSFPATLGACADRLKALGDRKSEAQKKVDAVAEEEKALEQHMVDELEKQESEGVVGRTAKARLDKKEVPVLKDDKAFYAYVGKKKAFHLLQKRLSSTAIREMWEQKQKVPGVDKFIHKSISVTKK